MKLSHFGFELPEKLLAKYPPKQRDESRLMILNRKEETIEHKVFKDIINYFEEGDVLSLNNTKVFPARLFGNKEKTGAEIEVFLLRELNPETRLWDVLVDPARKIRIGNKLFFGENDDLIAEVIDNTTSRGRTLRFLFNDVHDTYEEFREKLLRLGKTPLPKAIGRKAEALDDERYQTIYAKHEGSIAAPTAGLHFSKHLMKRLEIKGVEFAKTTLHVSLGTFNSVKVEDLSKYKMDSEQIVISDVTAAKINKAKKEKRRICAVGTTVLKTLESSVSSKGESKGFTGWTNKFIFPPYDFKIPTTMITNFHPPKSTLLMQTAAFGGYDFTMKAYQVAIKEKYKFSTYGDAMLII